MPPDSPTLSSDALAEVAASLVIPPRPDVLVRIEQEMARPEPDARRIAQWASQDVGLSSGILRWVNSPAMGLKRRIDSVDQCVAILGLGNVSTLITGICLQRCLNVKGVSLRRFWDVAEKRAMSMRRLAARLGGVSPGSAHSFGLFCDVGIPLLMQRFPDYIDTLKRCDSERVRPFTEPERMAHWVDHALIGSMMARSWGLSPTIHLAIRAHHEPQAYDDTALAGESIRLIAMSTLSELAIAGDGTLHTSYEWHKTGERAAACLVLSDDDVHEWVQDLLDMFAQTAL